MAIALIPSLSAGGAERQAILLHKHKVFDYIVTLENYIDYDQVNAKKIIHLSNHTPDTNVILRYLFIPIYIWRLFRVCKRLKQTIVVSFLFRADIVNVASKVFINGVHYVSVRNNPVSNNQPFFQNLLFYVVGLLFYPFADGIICNSQESKYRVQKFLPIPFKQLHFIPNAIDFDLIENKMHEQTATSLDVKKFNIIVLGRLANQKGFVELLDVISIIKADYPNICLNIIGKGPLEGLINKKIKKLNLNDQIKLLGFQSNPYAFIKNNDLFILSSFYEGMPNVLMEAMAIGGKIIATNCQCGVKELLTDSVVFDKSDKEVFSEFATVVPVLDSHKNKKIMANEIIRMIKGDTVINNNKRIQKVTTFSVENVTKQWKHVIK